MSLKLRHILALLLMYFPALVFGNTHVVVCVTEQGRLQFEFRMEACGSVPVDSAALPSDQDCGDCADYKIKIGETNRTHWDNHCDLFQLCAAFALAGDRPLVLPDTTVIEPSTSAFNRIGSIPLII